MADLKLTPLDEIPLIRENLKETFRAKRTRSLAWRRNQLYQLARLVQDNAEALAETLQADLGRPRLETYLTESGPLVERCLISAAQLEEWLKPELVEVPDWQKTWSPTIHKASKGVVLIIAPWNYPIILSLQPLIGAIAAGCCAVVKPSEIAPTYATLLADLLPKYLDSAAYRVVTAEIEGTTKLLELQWDHIFYTGNGRVARIISTAAAKYLTPMTLELGGKSPVIIDNTCDIRLAAKRVLYGKINNAGQICVSPDYVLIPREKQDEFITAIKQHYDDFFPQGALQSPDYSKIVSPLHFSRLREVLSSTKGQIAFGGNVIGQRFEPTVVRNVKEGDPLLDGEIFGPILPVVPVDSIDEAIEIINSRPHSLVLYAFSDDSDLKQRILAETTSGNVAFNDTFQQLSVNELPFGGVGESGYGRQILRYTYDAFTYTRSVVDIPKQSEEMLQIRYPPYTEEKFNILATAVSTKIPESHVNGETHN